MNTSRAGVRSIFVLLAVCTIPGGALKCYICKNARTNEDCNKPEHLQDCRDRSENLLDVCETSVSTKGGVRLISKECMKSPCVLLSEDANRALNMRRCVNNVCRSCCDTDACNKDAATPQTPLYSLVLALIVLTVSV